jgi:hypothetical protein
MQKNNFLILLFAITFYALYITACSNSNQKSSADNIKAVPMTNEEIVNHGKYLVTVMGCNDCHSPKKMGKNGPEIIPELMLSGYPSDRPIAKFDEKKIKSGFAVFYPDLTATAGPWGISFAGNLTPDETGIGTWTEEQFKKAITQGKFKGIDGGRMLLPPMPWTNFMSLKDDDVHAIFTYLKSIKAVRNVVPAAVSPDKM